MPKQAPALSKIIEQRPLLENCDMHTALQTKNAAQYLYIELSYSYGDKVFHGLRELESICCRGQREHH